MHKIWCYYTSLVRSFIYMCLVGFYCLCRIAFEIKKNVYIYIIWTWNNTHTHTQNKRKNKPAKIIDKSKFLRPGLGIRILHRKSFKRTLKKKIPSCSKCYFARHGLTNTRRNYFWFLPPSKKEKNYAPYIYIIYRDENTSWILFTSLYYYYYI